MKNIAVFILFFLFPISYQCGYSNQQLHTRIVGGNTAQEHSWPWIVSIRRRDINNPDVAFCGGSFINEKYDDNLSLNDIALIELSCKINLNNSNIGFICLPPKNISIYPSKEMKGIVAGWGSLEENGSISYTLQQIELTILSNKNQFCVKQISYKITQFCAGYIQGGKDACQGDSGGPLMIYNRSTRTWHIAGIISYGYGCARTDYPGVYTRVSMFVDWINEHINSSSIMKMSFKILLLLVFTVMCF